MHYERHCKVFTPLNGQSLKIKLSYQIYCQVCWLVEWCHMIILYRDTIHSWSLKSIEGEYLSEHMQYENKDLNMHRHDHMISHSTWQVYRHMQRGDTICRWWYITAGKLMIDSLKHLQSIITEAVADVLQHKPVQTRSELHGGDCKLWHQCGCYK